MTPTEYRDVLNRVQTRIAMRYMAILRVAKMDPLNPSRADYRLIHKLIESSFGSKVLHVQEDYRRIEMVFAKAEGSWQRLFLGSSSDMGLLKRIIRVAFKKGFLTKASKWR